MSETPKDLALARGEPPTRIYVSFHRDELNPRSNYFVGQTFLYRIDAEADAHGPIHEYALVQSKESSNE